MRGTLCVLLPFAAAILASCNYDERLLQLMDDMVQTKSEADADHQKYLAAFAARPAGDCQSPDLERAVSQAYSWARNDEAMSMREQGLAWALATADAAAAHGCPDVAHGIYDWVIGGFVGEGYAAYRQRAEIGLANLRAAR